MESQLKEQGASDKFAEVLQEIPRVREDLGFIPLVTPTSQIVGTQAVLNVLSGKRYKTIAKETAGVLKGEYGATPAPVNADLQAQVLAGGEPITCRPADLIAPEMDKLIAEVSEKAKAENVTLANNIEEDALIYGLFAQVGWKFLSNRGNPAAFEAIPSVKDNVIASTTESKTVQTIESYLVNVDGRNFNVTVAPGNTTLNIQPVTVENSANAAAVTQSGAVITSPMAGNIIKIHVGVGSVVAKGDVILTMEAMKMETEVRSKFAGTVSAVNTKEGAAVVVGAILVTL
jgi:oxaloacetate decarboxylase alpha subunit